VRERSDWQQCIRTVVPASAMGAELHPSCPTRRQLHAVRLVLQGARRMRKNSMNVYIHRRGQAVDAPRRVYGPARRHRGRESGLEATGIEYRDADGGARRRRERGRRRRGAMATRSCCSARVSASGGRLPSSRLIAATSVASARIIAGLFDEPRTRIWLPDQRALHEFPARRRRASLSRRPRSRIPWLRGHGGRRERVPMWAGS